MRIPPKVALSLVLRAALVSAQVTGGIHPRPTPSDYAAAQQSGTVTYAASVLSADQVKHLFAVDISKSYLVFEVASYPAQGGSVKIDPEDFLIRTGANSEFVHPADAVTVASVMQEKNTPKAPVNNGSAVYTTANVGYESGTDPYTGRRVNGVYTGAGVGVGPADPASQMPAPRPGSTPQDRAMLESQLSKNALPQGSFRSPVAGFLYFPAKAIKKRSNGTYELIYVSDPVGQVRLQVPVKSR
jgi:hypothetical protein